MFTDARKCASPASIRAGGRDRLDRLRRQDASGGGRVIDAPYIKHLPLEEKTLASELREHDYQTWHVGKWHLGGEDYYPDKQGFDQNIGGCNVGSPGSGGYFSPWTVPTLKDIDVPEGTYLDDYLTDQAVEPFATAMRASLSS